MNQFGRHLRISLFGESHGPTVGVVLDGVPAGLPIQEEVLQKRMDQRRPGRTTLVTARNEPDAVEILSGTYKGRATGAPILLLVRNQDPRSKDYDALAKVPRPGHADYPEHVWSHGHRDPRGGGPTSGRLTLGLVAAAAIMEPFLDAHGISVAATLEQVGQVQAHDLGHDLVQWEARYDDAVPCADPQAQVAMQAAIEAIRKQKDSLGASVQIQAQGLPVGLGSPWFESLESQLAQLYFAVPAIKAVGFGSAHQAASMQGSTHNDAYENLEGHVATTSNHHGGILGGRTTGMPLIAHVTVKPTSSIAQAQSSIDLDTLELAALEVKGRHDPCIGLRAVPVLAAATRLVLVDALLQAQLEGHVEVPRWSS